MHEAPAFEVEVTHNGRGTTVSVRGEVDISTVARLMHARDDALSQKPPTLLIDLRAVGFVDSSGLKFLLETYWLAQRDGWTLQLLKPPERVMKVFVVSGADRHLPFVKEIEA